MFDQFKAADAEPVNTSGPEARDAVEIRVRKSSCFGVQARRLHDWLYTKLQDTVAGVPKHFVIEIYIDLHLGGICHGNITGLRTPLDTVRTTSGNSVEATLKSHQTSHSAQCTSVSCLQTNQINTKQSASFANIPVEHIVQFGEERRSRIWSNEMNFEWSYCDRNLWHVRRPRGNITPVLK